MTKRPTRYIETKKKFQASSSLAPSSLLDMSIISALEDEPYLHGLSYKLVQGGIYTIRDLLGIGTAGVKLRARTTDDNIDRIKMILNERYGLGFS